MERLPEGDPAQLDRPLRRGAQVFFDIKDSDRKLEIFTTRPDTIFGVTFMVIAPEHEWVDSLTTPENRAAVEEYICQAKKRSERERIAETKRVSGVATGSYAINPFTGKAIPDLHFGLRAGRLRARGAIMAVPRRTTRATTPSPATSGWRSFPVVEGGDISQESYDAKSGKVINSDFLNGKDVKEAIGSHVRRNRTARIGPQAHQLPPARRHLLAPALLGRAVPDLLQERHRLPARRGQTARSNCLPSPTSAPRSRANRRWPASRSGRRRKGWPYELSTMPGFAGIVGLLPPLHGPAQRSGARRPGSRRILAQRGPLRRAASSTPRDTSCTRASGTCSSTTSGVVCEEEPFRKLVNQGMIQGPFELRVPHRRHQQVRLAGSQGAVPDAGALRGREHRPQRHPRHRRLPRVDARIQGRRIHPRRRANTSAAGPSRRCPSRSTTS